MPDVDVKNRHPAFFFSPNCDDVRRQFLVCDSTNQPVSQLLNLPLFVYCLAPSMVHL